MNERRLQPNSIDLQSIVLIVLLWLVLQFGGLFSPGLLDDVDSVYLEVAREMLHRHDFVTPYIDGIRFFDKPPLMYWLAAGSMRLFGEYDWAGRLPIAFAVLALLLAIYFLGRRLYGKRNGFYAAVILGSAIGPYLYTRFFIPDILIALWMTLGVHTFLIALDGAQKPASSRSCSEKFAPIAFAVVLALNLLTKGLIGLIFPLAFAALYLALTRQLRLTRSLITFPACLAFLVIALPWHVLAAIRNPPIPMPPGLGLPAHAGWTWFYLYNEHLARFFGNRIPHDYGQTPIWLFWVYALLWMMPWTTFLPATWSKLADALGHRLPVTVQQREAALTTVLWAGIVMLFFSISNRQEYYSLPALPAFALMIGGVLASSESETARRNALLCHRWLLLPLALVIAALCCYFVVLAPRAPVGLDLSTVLAQHPEMYNLSLGHLFDLTGPAMSLFRGPLAAVALGMLVIGPYSYLLRLQKRDYPANLLIAAAMVLVLAAAHEALVRFNPVLGSKDLAQAILREQQSTPRQADLILLDGELTSGSTLLFYTRQPVHLIDGRVNGPWFGSLWPDAPPIFETQQSTDALWLGPARIFLMTYHPDRWKHLTTVRVLAQSGGKTLLTNR